MLIETWNDRYHSEFTIDSERSGMRFLHDMFCTTQPTSATKGCGIVVVNHRDGSPITVGAVDLLVKTPVGVRVARINVDTGLRPGIEAGKEASKNLRAIGGKAFALLREQPKQAFTSAKAGTKTKTHCTAESICQIIQRWLPNPMADTAMILADSGSESQHCAN